MSNHSKFSGFRMCVEKPWPNALFFLLFFFQNNTHFYRSDNKATTPNELIFGLIKNLHNLFCWLPMLTIIAVLDSFMSSQCHYYCSNFSGLPQSAAYGPFLILFKAAVMKMLKTMNNLRSNTSLSVTLAW